MNVPLSQEDSLRELKWKQAALRSPSVGELFSEIANDETIAKICQIMRFNSGTREFILHVPGTLRTIRLLDCMMPIIGTFWDDFLKFLDENHFTHLRRELQKQLKRSSEN